MRELGRAADGAENGNVVGIILKVEDLSARFPAMKAAHQIAFVIMGNFGGGRLGASGKARTPHGKWVHSFCHVTAKAVAR